MHGSTRLVLTKQVDTDSRREALFASELQPSDSPTGDMIAMAISSAIQRFGSHGCTERMAQEFGDHPDTAVARMRWARMVEAEAFGSSAPRLDQATQPIRRSLAHVGHAA